MFVLDNQNTLYLGTSDGWKPLTGDTPEIGESEDSGIIENCIYTTWEELVDLRNEGNLIPGSDYRITDYECIINNEMGIRSAGHQFDIILTAIDESHLSETGKAAHHAGDTYFADNNLDAWVIKYRLDNDYHNFNWAIPTGKGVVYYMKDEWNNECPYDFKNIMFKRSYHGGRSCWSVINPYSDVACYTFSTSGDAFTSEFSDTSLHGDVNHVYGNVIKEFILNDYLALNNICIFGQMAYLNTFDVGCCQNTLEYGCKGNTFAKTCSQNTLNRWCCYNDFGAEISNCYFGQYCSNNVIGNSCYNIVFVSYSGYNTFFSHCMYLQIETQCRNNLFGNDCSHISVGRYSSNNTFGVGCNNLEFHEFFQYNTVGNNCSYINFPNTKYMNGNIFEGGCCYLSTSDTGSENYQITNYKILSSVKGSDNGYINLRFYSNRPYITTVAMNSRDEIVSYCESDLYTTSI